MRSSTPESRLATLMMLLLLTALIAGSAAGAEGGRKPQASGIGVSRDVVLEARDAVTDIRDTVRREIRASVRGHVARDTLRVSLREHAAAVRQMRDVRVDLGDLWRELDDGCPLQSADAHRSGSIGRAAHTLASMARDLTPKLGVLIGTGAKLLARFLL